MHLQAKDLEEGAQVPLGHDDLKKLFDDDESELKLAMDLVQKLLQMDASLRPTVEQALAHPYFEKADAPIVLYWSDSETDEPVAPDPRPDADQQGF